MTYDITIVAVTTVGHELTRRSIERTDNILPCRDILVLSDQNFYPGARYIDIPQSFDRNDYNVFMIEKLIDNINTEHVLVVQYDGMAVNRDQWTDEFLYYDYIGAPWLWLHKNQVGNGGFSLRSRRLLETLSMQKITADCELNEDQVICQKSRSVLESLSIRFASVPVAHRFSHEREAGSHKSFGFHGSFNVPYFLNRTDTEYYIQNMPLRDYAGQLEIIPYCYQAGLNELAELAIELGRQEHDDFDQKLIDYMTSIPGRFNFILGKL